MLVLTSMTMLKESFSQEVILIWKGGVHKDIFIQCCFVSENLIF